MRRNRLRWIWLPILLLLAAVRCGGGGDSERQIVFWQFWPSATLEPIIEQFEAENPEYEVVLEQLTWQSGQEKITAAVASGNVPDLVELGSTWFPAFAHGGVLQDWTDATHDIQHGYRLWQMCTVDGRIYGLPWLAGTRALYYNKELFARAGLDSSRGPETWAELTEAARKIDALGEEISGYGANAGERYVLFKKFMPYAWSNGAAILSPDGSRSVFNSPESQAALLLYVQLSKLGQVEQQSQLDQAFKEGRVGMTLSGSWLLAQIPEEAPDLRYGVTLVPKPVGKQSHSFAGGEILSSFQNSKNPTGALRLARFLLRPENTLAIAREKKSVQPTFILARDDSYYDEHPLERVFFEQLATAVAPPNHPDWLEMESAIESAVEKALHDRIGPAEAVAEASDEIDRILAANESD